MIARASAHRGDSSVFRENTLPAVRSAIAKGAEIVEIDVRLTVDGEVVVLHDPTLERLWGDARGIDEVGAAELRAFGGPDDRPPLLADVLPLFAGVASRLVVDMDDARFAAPAHAVASAFAAATGTTVDWCGDLDGMRVLRDLDASARIWLPWRQLRVPGAAELAALNPVTINVPFPIVDEAFVRGVHDAGLTVTAWTLDEPEDLARALDLGVDTITTNQLDRLLTMRTGMVTL
ncbi:glycerophosphodiester phosphodiesterase [Leifsonia sp. Leaf336]|uniref:glycerophosphodiester phosphodiesterase n=1 Tax=Leifsonia sp. Leaf336 TaxID=1736341 RepID=UPI0006F4BC3E|nr:glycerophosphodiester phosphodiesterase [Leifsonia sp. Leaf336]KQR53670.1 glycerophosphodiester phosphodiesterase [Leifsonia sp. Leaf336]